jgi:hypothetical protein
LERREVREVEIKAFRNAEARLLGIRQFCYIFLSARALDSHEDPDSEVYLVAPIALWNVD